MRIRASLPAFVLLGVFALSPAVAQESDPHLLDGTELEYTYTDGGSVVLTFYDGMLKFLWIAGPNEGAAGEDFEYSARVIGDDRYMVVWRMEEDNNFLTMVIDLEDRALFTSGLMGYETDGENVLFDEATISRVER